MRYPEKIKVIDSKMKYYNNNFQYHLIKLFMVTLLIVLIQCQRVIVNPLSIVYPCNENNKISIHFSTNPSPGQNFQYLLFVDTYKGFFEISNIQVKFDLEAFVSVIQNSNGRITLASNSTFIDVTQREGRGVLGLSIKGSKIGTLPHIQSIVINNVENCNDPQMGALDRYFSGEQIPIEDRLPLSESTCGRRKVSHIELIVNGQPTKPGDWPWHTAVYTLDGNSINYICGGTLLSKTVVLTAAHCVTIRGVPRSTSSISVILGKFNLIGGDIDPQEREIQDIKVHEQYKYRLLNNDIALLKLKSEVIFTDYVQPACLWHINDSKKIPNTDSVGVLVGWGFNQIKQLSSQLHQARIPKVSEVTCIRSHPVYFARMLNDQKFCAGYKNGTSACNGDSGGGFMVFVPDVTGDTSASATGAWHIHGIVSTSVSRTDEPICDPNHYVLFTDVAKFREWILRNMN